MEVGDRWRMVGGQREMGGEERERGQKGMRMKCRRWREGRKGGGRKMKRKVMNNVRKSRDNKHTVLSPLLRLRYTLHQPTS